MGPTPEATLPQVAPISQTAPADGGTPNIEAILASIAPKPTQQVPMTIQGHDSTPHVTEPQQKATIPMQNPTQGTATERSQAKIHNSLAQMSNMFNQYAQKQQQKKSDNLKAEVSTIVKAQAQIDNANAVLANDPNNANAKAVIDQNKKLIEAKFEDKHLSKELKKAFDVSFVDPEKNNTPEVKAAQDGIKEGEAAVKSGIAPNTPQEKQIQEQAANGGKPAVAVAQGAATALATQGQGQSSTPYADQFLKQQPATIQMNPQYQQQQLNEQAREKQINQYVIPKIIDAYTKQQIEQVKQGGLNARTEYAATMKTQQEMMRLAGAAKIADEKDRTELKKQAMADSTRMAQTTLRVNAALGAADAKGIKGTPLQGKVQQQALKMLDDATTSITKNNTELTTQQAANRDKKGNVIDQNKENLIRHQMDMNALALNQYSDQRAKTMTKIYGKPDAGSDSVTGNTRGYVNVTDPATGKSNGASLESVGGTSSDSDDDSDSAEDDAIVKSFDIDNQ